MRNSKSAYTLLGSAGSRDLTPRGSPRLTPRKSAWAKESIPEYDFAPVFSVLSTEPESVVGVEHEFDVSESRKSTKRERGDYPSFCQFLYGEWRRGRWTIIPEPTTKGSVIHPVDIWDTAVWLCTLFTVFWVPYDAVMFKHEENIVVAILLNVVFTVDIVATFCIANKTHSETHWADTSLWVKDPVKIGWSYMKPVPQGGYKSGWFLADFLCVAPGWISFYTPLERNLYLAAAARLALVMRFLAPISNIFIRSTHSRWDRLMDRAHEAYGQRSKGFGSVLRFLILAGVICHWMACLWLGIEGPIIDGLVSYSSEGPSWLTQLIASKGDPCKPNVKEHRTCAYSLALYYSWVTLSSVGYGDISPANLFEYYICTINIAIGYFLSAYVVGSFAALLQEFSDTHNAQHEQDVRMVDTMLERRGITKELKSRVRGYLHRSQDVIRSRTEMGFMETQRLSRALTKEVADEITHGSEIWKAVWWAMPPRLPKDAMLEFTRFLYPQFYGPREKIRSDGEFMLVFRSGLASYKSKFLVGGDAWGHENLLLVSPGLIDKTPFKSVSYMEALELKKEQMIEVCNKYPKADSRLRRSQIRLALFRAFTLVGRYMKQGVPFEKALGYIGGGRPRFQTDGCFVDADRPALRRTASLGDSLAMATTSSLTSSFHAGRSNSEMAARVASLENVVNDVAEQQRTLIAQVSQLTEEIALLRR